MDDTQIVELFLNRKEQAITETATKYGGFCFCLAQNILNNTQDSEEIVSDTYLRAWNCIPPRKPSVLKMFLAKITRNLAFDRWRSCSADKRGGGQVEYALEELAECVHAPGAVDDRWNYQELVKTIRSFLKFLSETERNVFLRRYFFLETTEQIAQRYAMKPNTVLHCLVRSRKKLREFLEQEGYTL